MLAWWEWQAKAQRSLAAARFLLRGGYGPAAVSRAYFASYQMVTAVLIKLGQTARPELGNWSHFVVIEDFQPRCKTF